MRRGIFANLMALASILNTCNEIPHLKMYALVQFGWAMPTCSNINFQLASLVSVNILRIPAACHPASLYYMNIHLQCGLDCFEASRL